MPTVIVDRVAAGIQMTSEDLERALTGVRRAVFTDERGNRRHLQGGEAVIWQAGQSNEYVIKAFKDDTEGRAEPEFEKLLLLQPSRYVPKHTDSGGSWKTTASSTAPSWRNTSAESRWRSS